MNDYLIAPRDWQLIAQREAAELLGTPEGAAKLAEAKRYGALADKIDRLEALLRGEDPPDERSVDDAPFDEFMGMLSPTIPT